MAAWTGKDLNRQAAKSAAPPTAELLPKSRAIGGLSDQMDDPGIQFQFTPADDASVAT